MTVAEAKALCYRVAAERPPRFDSSFGTSAKIAKLEDYLLNTAYWRSELEEARLHVNDSLHLLRERWKDLSGWEAHMGKLKSEEEVKRAKRRTDPALSKGIAEGEELVKRLSDQIRRLEHDDEVISRTYTFIVGG